MLVRNPYRAIISYWNFKTTLNQTGVVEKNTFDTPEFRNWVVTCIHRWFELIDDWIKFGNELYFVFYEDLKENPVEEIRKLLQYLGLDVDESRLACLSNYLTGPFQRIGETMDDPYAEEDHLLINNMVEKGEEILQNVLGRNFKLPAYKYTK